MLPAVRSALRTLYHGHDPPAQREADAWLRAALPQCDVPCALELLGSGLTEEQFFAAKALAHRCVEPQLEPETIDAVQRTVLGCLDQRLAQQLRTSAISEKLAQILATLLLRRVAQESPPDPLDWRPMLHSWLAAHHGATSVDLLSCLVAERLPEEFKLSQRWLDDEPLRCRLHRALQRSTRAVVQKASDVIHSCLADDPGGPDWLRAALLPAAATVLRSWLPFAESLTWAAAAEARLVPVLLHNAALRRWPALCIDVLAECLALPGRHAGDTERPAIALLLQTADDCLRQADPELLHGVAGLVATCAETTVELVPPPTPPALGFCSAQALLTQQQQSAPRPPSAQEELSVAICACLLRYTAHPEKAVSAATFGAWCRIQDGLCHPLAPRHAELVVVLLQTLIRQNTADPADAVASAEPSEELEQYRQGMPEPLRGCFLLLLQDYYDVLLRAWPQDDPPGPHRQARCEAVLYALWAVHPCKVDAAHRAVQFVLRAACAEVAGGLPARTLLEAMAAYPEAAVHDADMLWAWLDFIFQRLGLPHLASAAAAALQQVTAGQLPDAERLWPLFRQWVADPAGGVWAVPDVAVQASVLRSFANVARHLPPEGSLRDALCALTEPLLAALRGPAATGPALALRALECLAELLAALEEAPPCEAMAQLLERSVLALAAAIGATPAAQRADVVAAACRPLQPLLGVAGQHHPQLVPAGFRLLCDMYEAAGTPQCFSICSALLRAEASPQDAVTALLCRLLGLGLAAMAAAPDPDADAVTDAAPELFGLLAAGCRGRPAAVYGSVAAVAGVLQAAARLLPARSPAVLRAVQQCLAVFLQPDTAAHQRVLQAAPPDAVVAFLHVLLQQTQLEVSKRRCPVPQGSRGAQLALLLLLFVTLQPGLARVALPAAARDLLPPDRWPALGHALFERQSESKFRLRLADLLGPTADAAASPNYP